ncbi:MAG: acyl-CoA thioesterase [Pyrinomonadaceae bacterium MAG19_C2-C3]|nr:acyl-CoA thioesterase [Pyrinomonadaceae bacterium MAG19_C2-C3]
MKELLHGFPIVVEIPVAWGEMDAFGHVNNAVYFRYFETARSAYFERLRLFDLAKETGAGPILASINCRFKLSLKYPDTVSVGVRVREIESDRYVFEHRVVSHAHAKIAAYGEGVIVNYDYHESRKTPLTDAVRKAIEDLEATVKRDEA